MSKQTPMLMESLITKHVFVVTSYKDNGDGTFTARQKYDVTEQFDALAEQRNETCRDKNGFDESMGFECTVCETTVDSYMQTTTNDKPEQFRFCPNCRRAVER